MPAEAGAATGAADQPWLTRNDFSPLEPPALGAWTPTLSVSVVIPAHGEPERLALVLASLAGQSYPAHLTEVVVVDDGSPEPLVLPEVRPENTRLATSAPGGWGSAHAVNTGVAVSSGEVVLRLDADMLVYREHVESQMRWHHLVDYGVAMGHKLFVDFVPGALSPEHVYREVRGGRADTLFDRAEADPHWVERVIDRDDGLRGADHRAYRVFVGATGSLHRSLFEAAGGMDAGMVLGGDTEFGYRLSQQGAVFVPDLDTSSWHLGRSQMQTRRDAGRRFREPYVANRVPDFQPRRRRPGHAWEVPFADVVVDADGHTLEEVAATVHGLLDGGTPDIRVWLCGAWSALGEGRRSPLDEERLDLRLVRETFRGEPRVRFVEGPPEPDPRVPFRLVVPAGAHPSRTCVERLVTAADTQGAGLLRTPLPGTARAGAGQVRLERHCAFARARRLVPGAAGAALDDVVDRVYGSHWAAPTGILVEGADTSADRPTEEELRRDLERARAEAERLRARARRAERKLRWFTPGLGRRILRRIVR
ncbi:glycosyltransferase [Nocardiopsis sp. NPDC049922]|uniref:glycosyltransferase n=1 Tax=Nocardiopsis sp. NPDC049922 TaxID=3155157 RepID=UPI0034030C95